MGISRAPDRSTRDLILDAVDRLMARYGIRKMTMDDVAKEARVGKRTIYTYFQNKEDLGLSSIGRVVESVHVELEVIAQSDATPTAKVRRMLRRRVLGRIEHVKDYATSLDELFQIVRPEYMSRRAFYFEKERALLAGVLRKGHEEGHFAISDPDRTANAMLLATNAFLPYSLSVNELGAPESIAAQLESMIDLLMRGLCP